jgi:hypothetical protein
MSAIDRLIDYSTRPIPLRVLAMRRLLQRLPIGSYAARLQANAVDRPWYGRCLYNAAVEAKALGYKAITAVEMGVAGGNGLICLCGHKEEIRKSLGMEVVLVGFDTSVGLPSSADARDLLYCWPAGSFEMDRSALEKRIAGRAELVIGDVEQTVKTWNPRPDAPLGVAIFDLDLYSSTIAALNLLTRENVLPRVWCYLDDISGYAENAYTDGIGVRAAVADFNAGQERSIWRDHIMQVHAFKGQVPEDWHEQIYVYHRLGHPRYNTCLSQAKPQLSLTG